MKLKYTIDENSGYHPERHYQDDVGIDVYSPVSETISPCSSKIIATGVYVDVPRGYMLEVKPKSKNDWLIGAGVIEPGYQGQIYVKIVNYHNIEIHIKTGQPIAQLVLVKVETPPLEYVKSITELFPETSERGSSGGIVTQYEQGG